MNKATIRAQLLKQRKQLELIDIERKSRIIIQHLKMTEAFQQARHVALYLPLNGEVDIAELLLTNDKSFYLPSIKGKRMQFHLYTKDLPLVKHQFGVRQPKFIDDLVYPTIDLCLTPLVGFDKQGHRTGMGGGYYDRYFEHNKSTILTGIAYSFQQVKQLPVDSWDVTLHHIITEQGIITP